MYFQFLIISAAGRAFLCRREDWRRVGERFAGIWQTSNIPLAGLLFQRTQTLSRAKKRSCCNAFNRNAINYSLWKIEFAKLLDSSVLKAELNCPFCKVLNGWNLFTSQMDQNPTQIGLTFLYWSATYALLAPVVGCIGDKTVSFLFGIVTKTSFCEFFCGGGRAGHPVRYGVRKEMFKLRLTRLILVTNRVQFYSSKVSF